MLRGVIFDLDGTLVDHLGAQAVALDLGVARLGLGPIANGRPDLLSLWRQLERRHMDEYLAGGCSFDEQRRRRLTTFLPQLGHEVLNAAADADWWRSYGADYAAAWTAYEDVGPCFEVLGAVHPSLRLGVLTNGDGGQQRAKLDRIGVLDHLDGVYISSEIGAAKPDPASFAIACRGLGLRPSETLFVGDLVEIDALPAIAAGMRGVWLDRGGTASVAPYPRVMSLAEIPALVRGAV